MRYAALWTPQAEADLASDWLSSVDRNSVTSAANQIDILLRDDPLDSGESRAEPILRVLFVTPLGVDFEIVEEDRTVFVIGVWRITRE